MSEQLENKITPTPPTELYAALHDAWVTKFAEEPKRESLLVLIAQWAEETGWGHSCHCFNLGNVKHVDGDERDFTFFRCNEIVNGKEVWYDPPNPACCFRAYATLADGVADYLDELHKRFAGAWSAVVAGCPATFVKLLKQERYFTGSETIYEHNVVSIFNSLSRTISA